MTAPTYGYTFDGHPVHRRTKDHLPAHSAVARFNKRVAIGVTNKVGSMWCAYLFTVLALFSLPAVVSNFRAFRGAFPGWLIRASIIALVAWVAQTFIQLVLLPIIMVGQNVQAEASDARAAKTFADTETIVDRLDTKTQGGLAEVLAAIADLKASLGATGQP